MAGGERGALVVVDNTFATPFLQQPLSLGADIVVLERACRVDMLLGHPAVDRVLYPQLPDHPGHRAAAKQMRDFGGMVSFTLRGGLDTALDVMKHTQVFTLAESLGAVESLIVHLG